MKLIVQAGTTQVEDQSDDRSGHAHRQLIGYIGLVLPLLLIVIVLQRDGVEQWRSLDSISAYYYTGAVAAFVGMLVALALFLFTYRGYDNRSGWADLLVGRASAVAALGVAFFPTKSPAGVAALSWWTQATGVIHLASAFVLFAMFAVFSLWLFRLPAGNIPMGRDKRTRNNIYLVCGIVIVVCIMYAGYAGWQQKSIFWPESIALFAFAVSWLVKGYAHRTVLAFARSLIPASP